LVDSEQAQKRFYDLLWPHRSSVLRTAQILCGGNVAEADDLAQETMLKAFRAINRFEPGTNATAWLSKILRNVRIDRLRSSSAAADHVSLAELPEEPVDHKAPEAADARAIRDDPQVVLEQFSDHQVIEALQNLPEEIRWTLLLVDVEGMDHKEAAEVLDAPVGTIKSRAHRGRTMLKQALLPLAEHQRIVGS
jgi:RNA polymerase sigma-70 factor (ECF subfamily)